MEMEKKKLLVLSDYSGGITGFSNVARNILRTIYNSGEYDITQIGINYDGSDNSVEPIPYRMIPATSGMNQKYTDPFGRPRFLDYLRTGKYDIAFIIQDMMVVIDFIKYIEEIYNNLPKDRKFVTVFYTPVDSELLTKRQWVINSASRMDYPVTYTEFGKKEMTAHDPDLKKRLSVCYHGVCTKEFYPLPKEKIPTFRQDFCRGVNLKDRFVILNVNRNSIRKDFLKTFKIIAELKKTHPEVFLIAYAQVQDVGGDFDEIAAQCGLKRGVDYTYPDKYTSLKGITIEGMNNLYNSADCVLSTTTGEGWGLSTVEAMATKTPCVFPNNSALVEIFGGDGVRGRLVASGNTPDNFICYGQYDSSLVRPTVDVADAVKKLSWVIKGGPEVDAMVERGYDWVQKLDWEIVNKFWLELFARAWTGVKARRGLL